MSLAVNFNYLNQAFNSLVNPVQKGVVHSFRSSANTRAPIYIFGNRGRIGQELSRLAGLAGIKTTVHPEQAAVHLIAKGWHDAKDYISKLDPSVPAIDLSGYLKMTNQGTYGLIVGGQLLVGGLNPTMVRLGNPGCMASSIILGLKRYGLDEPGTLDMPLSISVTGGSNMASRSEMTGMRTGRLWKEHPHVVEIQKALPNIEIASFVPTVAHQQPKGLLAVISGKLSSEAQAKIKSSERVKIDVEKVLGTAQILSRIEVYPNGFFSLAVAADNLTLPSLNAILLASAILSRQEKN